jgi:radical SAM superfamily enzyme YgiQ (UPF0313 family)
MGKPIKNVMLVQPESTGGNFEYVAIPRQGTLFLSGALRDHEGPYIYDRQIWFEDWSGLIDPVHDLEDTDILLISALVNEAPRAYEIAAQARAAHPNLIIIGGGPHMGPLPEEAIREGKFDVIAQREAEDIIGPLCDIMLSYHGDYRYTMLEQIPGITFQVNGKLGRSLRPRQKLVPPDFVKLPDFDAVRDLTPQHPIMAGVLETVRGCVERCDFCQVIKQFLGYRRISFETELARIQQLQDMADRGLIYRAKNGDFSVFITDDLHPPPLRARKFRQERLERSRRWKGHTEHIQFVCQTRAELGQDPELMDALYEAGIRMLYIGVESADAENLKLVHKRQEPEQVHRDLVELNKRFRVVAMTIIGLPNDTEEKIMEMADWVRTVSLYQTANLLTPLPETNNWTALQPLDADGSLLPEGKMRPYQLYTGKQFVHKDEVYRTPEGELVLHPVPRARLIRSWSMADSRRIYDRYYSRLKPIDKMYEHLAYRTGFIANRQRVIAERAG